MKASKNFLIGLLIVLTLTAAGVAYAEPSGTDNAFLDAMTGSWSMDGITLGKSTHYALHGVRVLGGGFVRLQVRDKARPPKYQADVFVGYDRHKNDYIVHWLDQFGAAGARVVAEGHRDGNTLVLLFPYAESPFRDTFTYDPVAKTWTWLLESQEKRGKWSIFGRYEIGRK